MRHTLEQGKVTFFLEGELNTLTSEDVEIEIDDVLKGQRIDSIVFDMGDLIYITSAGLRILVRLKKIYNDTRLVRVQPEVYHVLEMVGFNQLFSIHISLIFRNFSLMRPMRVVTAVWLMPKTEAISLEEKPSRYSSSIRWSAVGRCIIIARRCAACSRRAVSSGRSKASRGTACTWRPWWRRQLMAVFSATR